MSEQKMREALELAILTMQRNVMKDCNHGQTSGLYAAIFKCQEALAAPAGEQVGLTDAEVKEHFHHGSRTCKVSGPMNARDLAGIRQVIAAHEAKRNGGAS